MTKNNLAVHLKWLLKHGPSLYPSLTPSEPANPVVDVARDTASDQPSQLFDVSGPGIAELPTDARIVLENTVGNDPVTGDADMGRLLLAPPSASKPRMLSLVNNGSRTPKPSNKEILDGSLTGVQRSPQRKAVQGMTNSSGTRLRFQ